MGCLLALYICLLEHPGLVAGVVGRPDDDRGAGGLVAAHRREGEARVGLVEGVCAVGVLDDVPLLGQRLLVGVLVELRALGEGGGRADAQGLSGVQGRDRVVARGRVVGEGEPLVEAAGGRPGDGLGAVGQRDARDVHVAAGHVVLDGHQGPARDQGLQGVQGEVLVGR